MAAALQKKPSGTKGTGGVCGAIVPPRKQVDNFPLMTYLAQNCSFDDADDDSSLENEEALKAANDKRVDEMLSKAKSWAKNQSKDESFSEEAARRSALEVLHSMELERNMKDTWKVSESNSKKEDHREYLYPLKPTKEDDYFSGVPKVKQTRERKRCRSDEVVLLDNGKLVPKTSVDYHDSHEVVQLPLKFSMPVRKPQRVPSVGLPFTPGPPPPTENNRWMQKSGTELFSNVQSQTLLVNGHEDRDLALAIAESIRTAKEEQQRNAMLETLYQSQNEATKSAKILARAPAHPSVASKDIACWEVKATPTDRNGFMSVIDSTNQIWDEEMTDLNSKDSTHEPNNNNHDNFKKSESTTILNEKCLDQRPRHREEQKTRKSPPPPMLADLEKTVSHEGKVITFQVPMKQSDEKEEEERPQNVLNEDQMSEKKSLVKRSESKQERRIPKTSHVPETFNCPKITSPRLPTSKPTALMTAMKNFTRQTNKDKTTHNYVTHKPRTNAASPEVPPLLVVPKDSGPEEKHTLNQPANGEEDSHNYLEHNETTAAGSPEASSLLNPSKKSVLEKEKGKTQQQVAVESLNLLSSVPEISSNAAFPQPQPHPPQPASLSSSISLEELPMASVQAQYQQMLMMQQGMAGTPQLLQNGQNLGGVNGQFSKKEKNPEMGQADQTASSMPSVPNFSNKPPFNTSSLLPTAHGLSDTSSADRIGPIAGSLSGLPNTMTPSMPEIPNSIFGGIPGLSNSVPGVMPPYPNALPGSIPGFPNCLAGPGLTNPPSVISPELNNLLPGSVLNPYASFMPGLTNPYLGVLPGLTNPFSGGMPGLTNPLPSFIPGVTNLLPGSTPGLADSLQGAVPNLQTLSGGLPDSSSSPGMPSFAQHGGLSGYPNAYPGVSVSSHSSLTPSGVPGFQNAVAQEFQMNPLSNMQGFQSNLPVSAQTPVSTSLTGFQNCNSFGGLAQSFTTPQPGSTPLMGGRGRGRLAPTTLK